VQRKLLQPAEALPVSALGGFKFKPCARLQAADFRELWNTSKRLAVARIHHNAPSWPLKAVNCSRNGAMHCHGCSAIVLKVSDRAGTGCLPASVVHRPKRL